MLCFVGSPKNLSLQCLGDVSSPLPGKLFYTAPQKRQQDSFVDSRGDEMLIFEGIVANSSEIMTRYAAANLKDLLWRAALEPEILAQLHGQYWLLKVRPGSSDLLAFTSLTNNSRLYYYHSGDTLILSDKIRTILRVLKENGISYSVDPLGARMILSYGFMLEGFSTIKEVRNLPASSQLSFSQGKMQISKYHTLKAEALHKDPKAVIAEVDHFFSKAVIQAFSRDVEDQHLAFLSGGLDSRMVVFTAHKHGFREFDVLNFSEPDYLDHTIARDIAREMKLDMNFFSLEHGTYLQHIAENLHYNEAQIVLHGSAHLNQALKSLDAGTYSIIHSGQIGAILKGGWLDGAQQGPADLSKGTYSSKIMNSLIPELESLRDSYSSHEVFMLLNRGFNALNNGDLACYQYSHSLSAFMHPEFLQYSLNIDPALRYRCKIYFEWIRKLHPDAAGHKWERTGAKLTDPYLMRKLKYNLWRGSDKILNRILRRPGRLNMNPFDHWWQSNPTMQAQLQKEFSCIDEVMNHLDAELAIELKILRDSSQLSEKMQAYTLAKGLQYLMEAPAKLCSSA